MRTLTAFLAILPAALAADSYRIAGTVVHAGTGTPAARIRVGIVPDGQNSRESFTVTGPDGSFRFAGLAKGIYTLTADHPSGIRQRYGQPDGGPAIGTAIVTGPDFKNDALVFRLFPPAAIHGRVVDQAGDPVEDVLIQLYRSAVVRGRRSTFFAGSVRTNDIGEYRFGPIQAGTYYLLATGRPWYTERLSEEYNQDGLTRMTYLPTFYPNSRDPRSAAPIRLRSGEDFAAGLILTALPAGALKVSAVDPSQPTARSPGAPPPRSRSSRIDIVFEGPGGAICWERVDWLYGTKEYGGIPPGQYAVRVFTDESEPLYGQETVVIAGTSPVQLDVPLAKLPVVTGTLKLENGAPVPPGTVVELENEAENRHIRRPVDAKGEFRFDNAPPGQYTPILYSTDSRLRLSAVTVDGRPARDAVIDLRRPMQLDLAGIAAGAEVSGYVYRNGEPLPGVLVLLAPKRESLTPYDYMAYQTDSDGSFRFPALSTGAYRLVAIEDWLELEYAKLDALRPYLAAARDVDLPAIAKQEIRIDLK